MSTEHILVGPKDARVQLHLPSLPPCEGATHPPEHTRLNTPGVGYNTELLRLAADLAELKRRAG